MKRKRRKSYRKWSLLKTRVCISQPPGQACGGNTKDLGKEVERDTAGTAFHQTGTSGKSKENGDEQTSASRNGKQSSSFLPTDKKGRPPDRTVCWGEENDGPPSAISPQLKEASPAPMFNDRAESLAGKVTLQDSPSTAEAFRPAKGKYITEVNWGAFNVKIEIKKSFFYKAGIWFPTKKRCARCHQGVTVRHRGRSRPSRDPLPKPKRVLGEAAKPLEPERLPECEEEMARTEIPLLKVSLVGKEVKVKCVSKEHKVLINITHPKRKEKITKCRNIPSISHSQSGIKPPEQRLLGNQSKSPDQQQVSPPTGCTVQQNFDAISLTSTPEREREKPDSSPSVSADRQVASARSQPKALRISQDTCQKDHFSEAETLLKSILSTSHSTLQTTSFSNTDLSKTPFENPKDVHKERKINFDILENNTSAQHVQQITEEANPLPRAVADVSPFQNSGASPGPSGPSPDPQPPGEQAASAGPGGGRPAPAPAARSSQACALWLDALSSQSPWAHGYPEPQESPRDPFSSNHCTECVMVYEKELAAGTDRDLSKDSAHSDSHAEAPQLPEPERARLAARPDPSALGGVSYRWAEGDQTGVPVSQCPEAAAPGQMEAPVTTVVTDDLEQRLITHNDAAVAANSNCPVEKKTASELPCSPANAENDKRQIMPLVRTAGHRDSEDLSHGTQDEVFTQEDFPLRAAEANWGASVSDNLPLPEKTAARDADQDGNPDENSFRRTSFKQETAEYQRVSSKRLNSEGDENKDCSHQIDMLLSPQKQKALKDWHLEINNLRKLSQELAPRSARASDGSQEEAVAQWARRRRQLREGSAGGSSFASSVTEGSGGWRGRCLCYPASRNLTRPLPSSPERELCCLNLAMW
ncbi:NAD-capped RNA hydrolase NUDT12 isoform X1 [Nycticebus coucang]|uniref:NAD-capped RNA hydrolase NUDT12 isoform X1 n=1 Tax=Nycticebus coucang TaxID=9470 RepID=UPI00234CF0EC|nr:NAD-capped RNA hydrolase NUDT12 isoform X1 [Nycticebus coucang]